MRSNGIRHRAVCAVLLVSSVLVADAHAGVFRLRRTVVVGDSLLAGFGSGGFIGVGRPGQVDSAPAFIARRAHVRLPLPFMTGPGVPPPLVIMDANRNGRLDRGEVRRASDDPGFRADSDKTARNLAVPGEDTGSVFASTRSTPASASRSRTSTWRGWRRATRSPTAAPSRGRGPLRRDRR